MTLWFDREDPEPVNALEYLCGFGISEPQAISIILHLLLTRTYVIASEAREAAAELGVEIPYVHPGDSRMH